MKRYLPVVLCVGVVGEVWLVLGGGQCVPWSTWRRNLLGEVSTVGGGGEACDG